MKVVINLCFGGFGLSRAARLRYAAISGRELPEDEDEIERTDPALVQTVEELGSAANAAFARLTIVDVPDGVDWEIETTDGLEVVAERHRTWP